MPSRLHGLPPPRGLSPFGGGEGGGVQQGGVPGGVSGGDGGGEVGGEIAADAVAVGAGALPGAAGATRAVLGKCAGWHDCRRVRARSAA